MSASATEAASIEAASLGISGSADVAVSGGIGVNQIDNTTDAHVSGGATITAAHDISFIAQDTSSNSSLTGQAAGSLVGIGGAVSYNVIGNHVRAYVNGAKLKTVSEGNIIIEALSTATINTITAGLSGGFVGIAGTVAVTLLNTDVAAYIVASVATANGNMLVFADSTNQLQVIAGSVAGGAVGVGGTVVVNTMGNNTQAYIEDSTVSATGANIPTPIDTWNASTDAEFTAVFSGIAVVASSTETPNANGEGHSLIAVNASGGFVGVGGVVTVTTVSDITKAFIASSQVNVNVNFGGQVIVNAHANDYLLVISGGVAGGAVAVGGTVDRTTISSQTSAFISSSDESGQYAYPTAPSVVWGGGVQVTTETFETVDMTVLGIVGGAVAVAGAVSVLNIDATNNAFVHDSDVYSLDGINIAANDTPSISTKVGVLDGGAVGAAHSVSVNTIQNTVQAEALGGHLNATLGINITATSNESIAPFVGTGSLGGVALAGAVAVDTITTTTQALVENGSRPALINQDSRFQPGGVYGGASTKTLPSPLPTLPCSTGTRAPRH